MSCPECEALHAKIRTYESLLGTPEEAQLHRIRQAFGFSQNEAAALMSLVNADGMPISVHAIAEARPVKKKTREPICADILIKVTISHLRRRLGADAIVNDWGIGYAASPQCIRLVRDTLAGGL
jgi:hypothetical protein